MAENLGNYWAKLVCDKVAIEMIDKRNKKIIPE